MEFALTLPSELGVPLTVTLLPTCKSANEPMTLFRMLVPLEYRTTVEPVVTEVEVEFGNATLMEVGSTETILPATKPPPPVRARVPAAPLNVPLNPLRAAVVALDAEEEPLIYQPTPKKTTAMTIAQMTNVDFLFILIESIKSLKQKVHKVRNFLTIIFCNIHST